MAKTEQLTHFSACPRLKAAREAEAKCEAGIAEADQELASVNGDAIRTQLG